MSVMASSYDFLLLTSLLPIFTIFFPCNAQKPNLPKFSSILIFGDSLLDTGNNNFISTLVQANHPPYGVSFPGGVPTGRFSDGKLMSDFVAEALGLKDTVPPFLDPNLAPAELQTGVCFASAGSGYDDNTVILSNVTSVTNQYQIHFKNYKQRLIGLVGENESARSIGNSLVFVTSGTNDMVINHYANPLLNPSISQYQDFLITRVERFIRSLYEDGCRNFAIAGLPPVCGALEVGGFIGCTLNGNSDPNVYNRKLRALLTRLQPSLPGSRLVYADILTPLESLALNLIGNGIFVPFPNCCGEGTPAMGLTCNTQVLTCPNPANYFRWDSIHPTQTVYRYMSNYLIENVLPKFNGNTIAS